MHKLLIATGNRGKVVELQSLLAGLDVALLIPKDLGLEMEVIEDGLTYEENAGKKALAYGIASGLITLADDSGLEVDALNGAPGLHSARYSPKPGADDADRRAYLLSQLTGYPRPWKAHFHCTVAIWQPGSSAPVFVNGNCFGEIIPNERGSNGFGYDPLFYLPELGQTMAEITTQQKNTLSHRALAVKNAIPILEKILRTA